MQQATSQNHCPLQPWHSCHCHQRCIAGIDLHHLTDLPGHAATGCSGARPPAASHPRCAHLASASPPVACRGTPGRRSSRAAAAASAPHIGAGPLTVGGQDQGGGWRDQVVHCCTNPHTPTFRTLGTSEGQHARRERTLSLNAPPRTASCLDHPSKVARQPWGPAPHPAASQQCFAQRPRRSAPRCAEAGSLPAQAAAWLTAASVQQARGQELAARRARGPRVPVPAA